MASPPVKLYVSSLLNRSNLSELKQTGLGKISAMLQTKGKSGLADYPFSYPSLYLTKQAKHESVPTINVYEIEDFCLIIGSFLESNNRTA